MARAAAPDSEPPMPLHEVRRHVDALLAALSAALRGDSDRARVSAAADALAVDRAAQGVSLRALLDGFHAARQVVLRELLRHTMQTVSAHRLLPVLMLVDAEVGALEHSMVVAHQEAERRLGRAGTGSRVEALRRLFTDGDPVAATELGLDRGRRHRCVLLDVSAPAHVRRVDVRLAALTGTSGLVAGYLTAVTSGPPPSDTFADVLVMCSPPVAARDLPLAHVVCRDAVDVARGRGHTGVRVTTDYAVDLAVSAQPGLGRMLVQDLLAALDPTDASHHELAETALAYLSHGARLQATATTLHVHPNTVAHRLRRLGTLTGFTTGHDGDGTFEQHVRWWWALRTWLVSCRTPGGARPTGRGRDRPTALSVVAVPQQTGPTLSPDLVPTSARGWRYWIAHAVQQRATWVFSCVDVGPWPAGLVASTRSAGSGPLWVPPTRCGRRGRRGPGGRHGGTHRPVGLTAQAGAPFTRGGNPVTAGCSSPRRPS